MSRIVFISPYRDLSNMAKSVAADSGVAVEFYEGSMEESVHMLHHLAGPAVDVCISRGGTAELIARNFDFPVVTVNTSTFDIMECCEEARNFSTNIAVTSFGKPYVGMSLLARIMDVSIHEVVFCNLEELESKIRILSEEGNFCIVGGGPSVTFAKKYGLTATFLRTSRETIQDAFIRALDIAKLRREEKRKAYRLQTIVNCAYDGIIAVDSSGKVEIFNPAAARIMNINQNDVLGRNADEVIPNTRLTEILKNGQAEIKEIQDIGDARIVTSRVPIKDNNERIIGAVATFEELSRVLQVEQRMRKELTSSKFTAHFTFTDIIGESSVIKECKNLAQKFSQSDLTVFIYGESGTGKEMFAQGIHNGSSRAHQPFVAINCGALPPSLLESELFGYDEGAFTGAKRKGKAGLFELAHNGTIFLDEIDSLPIEMQGRLLRVLQEREVLRIGGTRIIPVNIRIIAATNKNPRMLLEEKKMREDLFYRLNVLYLQVPALRERKSDIPLLVKSFTGASGFTIPEELLVQLLTYLQQYSWPGNIREVWNFSQRLSFFKDQITGSRTVDMLQVIAPDIVSEAFSGKTGSFKNEIATKEKEMIFQTLKQAGSLEKAAKELGIGKTTLWRKLQKYK